MAQGDHDSLPEFLGPSFFGLEPGDFGLVLLDLVLVHFTLIHQFLVFRWICPGVDSLSHRVASRYVRAAEDEAAFEVMADYWADVFLDELAQNARIGEKEVDDLLRTQGVTADDVNALVGMKQAGLGNLVRALGGWIATGAWHMIAAPFIGIGKFITSSKFRSEVKNSFRRALNHEVRSTKHMINVAGRLMRGEEVSPQEKKTAMHQLVDILSKAVLAYFAGPHIAHMFSHGIWKALAALLSPIDEIVVVLLDKPLRAANSKLLSADLGLLPSGFYTHFA